MTELANIIGAWVRRGAVALSLFGLLCAVPAHALYYGYTTTTFSWIDPVAGAHTAAVWTSGASCTAGTYVNAPGDDDITAQIPIGFTFNFGGTGYTQLQIMTNGRLQFNNGYCGWGTNSVGPPPTYPYDFPTGTPLGNAGNVVRMIRIYGADFDPGASAPGGRVYYTTTGTAPNRKFIVTWYNVREWNSPGSYFNMQIILNENGDFVYQYKDTVNITTGHAQIGWEVSATDYDILPYAGFGSLAYTAIRFYAAPKRAEWQMDESAWTGAAGEIIDTGGNGYNAQAVNGATNSGATPAIATNPGTCRYGTFNGTTQYVAVPGGFPNLNQSFTIGAWIRTQDRAKAGQKIFVDDQSKTNGYGLTLGDNGAGVITLYNRASTPVSLDTSAVIQNNLWYYVAAVIDLTINQRYIYVYDASGTLLTSATTAFAGWGTDAGPASIGGVTNASADAALNYRFKGDIDQVKIYDAALPQATLDVLAKETHPCPIAGATLGGFNVFESSTPAGFVAGYIKTKTAGRRFDTTTGNLAIVALVGGAIDNTYNNTVRVELLDASAGGPLDSNGCNAAWTPITVGSFPFTQTISGGRVNMNPIPQVNARAYPNLKIRVSSVNLPVRIGCSNDNFAIRPDRLQLSNPTHDGSAGATWGQNADPSTANTGTALINGNATGAGEVHKAGRNFSLRVQAYDGQNNIVANYGGSPVGGISALVLPSPSNCSTCVPGTLTVGGWGPDPDVAPLHAPTGTVVSDTATYSEVGSFAMHVEDHSYASVDLIDTPDGQRWVDSNVIPVVGRFVPDHFDIAPVVVPIFATFNATDAQCNTAVALPRRSFTYIGQPFAYSNQPQFLVKAMNAGGTVTALYRGTGAGGLWKLGTGTGTSAARVCTAGTCTMNSAVGTTTFSNAFTFTTTPAVGAGWDTTSPSPPGWAGNALPRITHNNNGTGTLDVILSATNFDYVAIGRANTPTSPFTAIINASLSLADTSEGLTRIINTGNTGDVGAIAFDATYIDPVPANNQPNRFFYGRLRLQNANGSQLITMPVPMTTEYWNGSTFVTNNFDHCTGGAAAPIAAANIAIGNPQNGLTGAMVSPPVLGGALNAGRGSLRLQAPGAGRRGSVDVSVNLTGVAAGASCTAGMPASTASRLSFLQGAWCGATYTNDPTARTTFGIYRNSNQFIYQQENY